jgi:hypothetical protein
MKLPMYSQDGKPRGDFEIPDDVIAAARLVSNYLGNNPNIASLCGLYIKICKIEVEINV